MRQILQQILQRATGDDDDWRPPLSVLREAWPGLVGEHIAAVTRLSGVNWNDGRLTVEVATQNWKSELQRHEGRLLKRIRRTLPWRVDSLEIRVGMIETSDRSQGAPDKSTDDQAENTTQPDEQANERTNAADEDVESTLDTLDDQTADAARSILEHIRDDQN